MTILVAVTDDGTGAVALDAALAEAARRDTAVVALNLRAGPLAVPAGAPVTVVFGKPIDFGTMLDGPPSPRLHRRISEHTLDAIRGLGEEERAIRSRMG